ncbi:hypothetical protein SAMN04244548_04586 [Paracoccus pantotrophus]|nr:hypothetical protein SAMN04244548_04586 [Paracoccus pantotrophus]
MPNFGSGDRMQQSERDTERSSADQHHLARAGACRDLQRRPFLGRLVARRGGREPGTGRRAVGIQQVQQRQRGQVLFGRAQIGPVAQQVGRQAGAAAAGTARRARAAPHLRLHPRGGLVEQGRDGEHLCVELCLVARQFGPRSSKKRLGLGHVEFANHAEFALLADDADGFLVAGNRLPRQRLRVIARVAIGTDQLGDPGQPRRAQIRLGGFQAGPCALPLAPPNRLNTKPAPRLEALTFCTAAPAVEPRSRDASAEPDAWAARTPVPRRSAAAARMRSRAAASSRFCFNPRAINSFSTGSRYAAQKAWLASVSADAASPSAKIASRGIAGRSSGSGPTAAQPAARSSSAGPGSGRGKSRLGSLSGGMLHGPQDRDVEDPACPS